MTDHKALAEHFAPRRDDGLLPNRIAASQAHATLALVEELRTANLIARAAIYVANNGQTFPEIEERL